MECSCEFADAGGDADVEAEMAWNSATAERLGGRVHLHQQARSSSSISSLSPVRASSRAAETVDDLPHLVEVAQLGRPEPGDLDGAVAVGPP